ncbi:MAG TPA: hypothetical protein VEW48_13190 [Thermoanaerobaculia bacterium]|nr:hypothetical protein [Thermoanaerobaculia bacterium]
MTLPSGDEDPYDPEKKQKPSNQSGPDYLVPMREALKLAYIYIPLDFLEKGIRLVLVEARQLHEGFEPSLVALELLQDVQDLCGIEKASSLDGLSDRAFGPMSLSDQVEVGQEAQKSQHRRNSGESCDDWCVHHFALFSSMIEARITRINRLEFTRVPQCSSNLRPPTQRLVSGDT